VNAFKRRAKRLLLEDDGPTATEYAVMLAVICIAVLATMATFGERVTAIYTAINEATGTV
jgi:Flp pilus assembly pilin Flp